LLLRPWTLRSELLGGLGGVQLVQVIDDQDERITGRADFGQYLVHHGEAVEAGCRGRRLRTAVCAGGVADRAENGEPEQLRVMLAGPHRHEGDRAVLTRTAGPHAQQRGLPAAGGRRDDGHLLLGGVVQRGDQVVAVDQSGPGRAWRPPRTHRGGHIRHRAIPSGHGLHPVA
jgi:hypothetical protein